MKKDREKLSDVITAILLKNNSNNKLREKLEDELQNKFRVGVVNDIYNLRRPIKFLTDEELYLITNSLYNNYNLFIKGTDIKKSIIDPPNWFTDNEIIKANQINFESVKEDDIYFTLHNVDEVEEGVWVSSHETYKNLADNFNSGAIYYNPETQREGIIKTVLGEQIKVPKINKNEVDEIYSAMKNREYFLNTLTFNVLETGAEKEFIQYFPRERILKVKKTNESVVDCVDGMHRLSSIVRLMSENPDFEGNMIVRVFNLNVQKAQQSIRQETLGTAINLETVKTFDVKNKYMQVAKRINEYESEATNSLYHKLTASIDEVKLNSKYCLFSNIANGLEDNFNDLIENASPRELDKLTRYLVSFFNEFIGIYDNYFSNLEMTKKNMVIADINIFTAMLLLARKLYETKGWQDTLEDILSNIIWDRTNSVWKTMLTNSLTWNKATKTKIYNFFDNLIDEKVGVV